MDNRIWSDISGGVISFLVERTFNYFSNFVKEIKKKGPVDLNPNDFPKIFSLHYTEVLNWSSDIPFINLSKNKSVSKSTIELSISSKISKIDKQPSSSNLFSELDILNTESNVIILGKPGAGKTTTVKRLITNFFTNSEKVKYTNPLLIRLRDLTESRSVSLKLLDILNINWEYREEIYFKKVQTKKEKYEKRYSEYKYYIKGSDILVETFLPMFLNSTNSILFLDGYDELIDSLQKDVLIEIENLGLKLNNSKIVLTSRTSSFAKIFSNFEIFEINPLNKKDIIEISEKWLGNGPEFIAELDQKKYFDLANRPIFLTLLLILFENNSSLPLSPYEVYREAVYLIIRDWDEHRGIKRVSQYASFNVRKKLDFLQEVSMYLTYNLKSNSFSSSQLELVYKSICSKYDLPIEDMTNVVREIESHNGLISEVGYKTYIFSHLSLQEYLCAECIVSLSFSKVIVKYFFDRPDPLAIAVCLSRDSGMWLANLFLNSNLNINKFTSKDKLEDSMVKFLSRLIEERPAFGTSLPVGVVFLYLVSTFIQSDRIFELILAFIEIKDVKDSIHLTLENFTIKKDRVARFCVINRIGPLLTDSFLNVPYKEIIDLSRWELLEVKIGSVQK